MKIFKISILLIFALGTNFFSFSNSLLYNQTKSYLKYELKIGAGLEQGFNIGFNRYYTENFNFGLGVGSLFPPKEHTHHMVVSAENNFHFQFLKNKRNKPSLLFNQQVICWKYSEPEFTHQAITFAINVGLRIEKPSNFGFIFEIGPSITYTLKFEKEPNCIVTPITNKLTPNFRILIFQRF